MLDLKQPPSQDRIYNKRFWRPPKNQNMIAIISDIHANIEALEAVIAEIFSRGIDEIWCLGDIVGYGPNPNECVDTIMDHSSLAIMGNHDWALLHEPVGFSKLATRSINLTKQMMDPPRSDDGKARKRLDYLSTRGKRTKKHGHMLVHASPAHALTEYVVPWEVEADQKKYKAMFERFNQYCFVGHSHLPCVITEDLRVTVPEDTGDAVTLGKKKAIINVGSVGQPRDGDNRACFAVLDDRTVRFVRVPYDKEKTGRKILELDDEMEFLANRLKEGR